MLSEIKSKVLVDIHNHIYPDNLAERAVQSVGEFYTLDMLPSGGTVSHLLGTQERGGFDYSLVQSVALTPKQVTTINDFIAEQCQQHSSFIGFGTMHHDFADKQAEVERAIALGLKGMKLHPDSQGVNADDDRLMEFYALIEGRLPLMLHCGDYRYDYSHPHRVKRILQEFPNLVVNCAHFGGWSIFDLAVEYLEDENCYLDISSSTMFLGKRRTTELIKHYGAKRILFGSDYPMWSPIDEMERLGHCELSAKEQEQIMWHSAESYLGMELG
jgi:predicted TIM-barrel fold metal-dependent hydrolase